MVKSVVIFISGNGTNLQRVIDRLHGSRVNIKLVVSNRKNAYGLTRASENDIPTLYMPFIKKRMDRIEYDLNLADAVLERVPDLDYIFCLGWMHILSSKFIDKFAPNTIVNLHPAPPGRFPGRDAIQTAFDYYKENPSQNMWTGVMFHYVTPVVDVGKVISKIIVPVYETDTIDTLRYRIVNVEKEVLVNGILKLCGC